MQTYKMNKYNFFISIALNFVNIYLLIMNADNHVIVD